MAIFARVLAHELDADGRHAVRCRAYGPAPVEGGRVALLRHGRRYRQTIITAVASALAPGKKEQQPSDEFHLLLRGIGDGDARPGDALSSLAVSDACGGFFVPDGTIALPGAVSALCVVKGMLFAGLHDGTLIAWDIDRQQQCHAQQVANERITAISCDTNHGTLAIGALDGKVRLLSWRDGSRQGEYDVPRSHNATELEPVYALAYEPQGGYLLAGSEESLALFGADGKPAWQRRTNGSPFLAVCWRPQMRTMTAADADTIHLRGRAVPQPDDPKQQSLKIYAGTLTALAWSPDGNALAGGTDRGAITCRAAEEREPRPLPDYYGGSGDIAWVHWHDDRTLLACGREGVLLAWRATAETTLPDAAYYLPGEAWCAAAGGDGRYAVGSADGTVHLFRTEGGA